SATNLLSPIGRHRSFASQRTRRGAFVQKSQRPNAGPSAYFRNRQNLLAVTASAALLAGIACANALPLTQQYEVGRSAKPDGAVPSSPASHGCVRLPESFARQMWGITRLGVRVIIARSEVTPVPIANARLFTIKPVPAEPNGEPPARSPETVGGAAGTLEFAQ